MPHDALVNELRDAVSRKQALCIAGAGVTISATGDPQTSWTGLLHSGLDLCLDVGSTVVDDMWAARMRALLSSAEAADYLTAGQEIADKFHELPGNWFHKWLRSTAGSYVAVHPGIPTAIAELRIPIATTNYDDILLNAIGGSSITWRNPEQFQEMLRGLTLGVFHIHGHWRDANSIVLGANSYDAIVEDQRAQQHLRAALAGYSAFFVGFGAGLSDPNFLQLRQWIREILVDSNFPPTVLVRNADLALAANELHPDGIQVVSYGDEFGDLELFLADLRTHETTPAAPKSYDWEEARTKLERLHLRIKREFHPEVVVAISGPGNFAPLYCMRVDQDETPVVSAVTFPKTSGRSLANTWFSELSDRSGWNHISSTKWDVFLPNLLDELPVPSRVLIFDDRTIGGNVQRMVKDRLTAQGHDVRRAALVVHPDIAADIDWYEDELAIGFSFPWGNQRGRS